MGRSRDRQLGFRSRTNRKLQLRANPLKKNRDTERDLAEKKDSTDEHIELDMPLFDMNDPVDQALVAALLRPDFVQPRSDPVVEGVLGKRDAEVTP
jgi:hypothetical protein